jgi:hypothetical protein
MSLFLQTPVLGGILFREQDAVGLQDLQEEANEIEIIRGRIFIRTGNDSL